MLRRLLSDCFTKITAVRERNWRSRFNGKLIKITLLLLLLVLLLLLLLLLRNADGVVNDTDIRQIVSWSAREGSGGIKVLRSGY